MRLPRIRELFGFTKAPACRKTAGIFLSPRQHRKMDELVRMTNVSVQYDDRAILSGINWTIRRGESWALTGPNGSGKSTLLSLICGDNPQAYANSICLFGRYRGSGESVWHLKRRIGLISSELHLHFPDNQTCLETVLSGFHESIGFHGSPSSRQRKIAHRVMACSALAN